MVTGFVGGGDFGARSKSAEREAISDAFRGTENVRLDAEVFDGKHFSSAGETGLHFVANEQDTVLVEDFLYFLEVVCGRHDDPAFSPNRLGNECGDITCSGKANNVFQSFRALAATLFRIVWPIRAISVGHRSE